MAPQQSKSNQRRNRVAKLALAAFAVCQCAPLLAATPNSILCDDTGEAALDFVFPELSTQVVDHDISMTTLDEIAAAAEKMEMSPARLLAPRAEAAIRNAFGFDDEFPSQHESADYDPQRSMLPIAGTDRPVNSERNESRTDKPLGLTTRLPGISDDDLSRYKKQMYRRDI